MAKRLERKRRGAVLGGVASGYGDYLDIDPVLVRIGFILLSFVSGVGVILYLVSWVIMPVREQGEPAASPDAPPRGDAAPPSVDAAPPSGEPAPPGGAGIGARAERAVEEMREAGERVIAGARRSGTEGGRGQLAAGVVLIVIGLVFLADRLPWLHWPHFIRLTGLWPLILVGAGLVMLLGALRGEQR